jgi:CBS domain-containing protein
MSQIEKTISEVLSGAEPAVVAPGDSAGAAAELMRSRHTSCVLVCDEGSLEGIFTERDYLNLVAAERQDPETILVRDVMTANPETLERMDSIAHAIHLMAEHGFRNIPIMNRRGGVAGLLTVRDVVGQLGEIFSQAQQGEGDGAYDDWIDIGGG